MGKGRKKNDPSPSGARIDDVILLNRLIGKISSSLSYETVVDQTLTGLQQTLSADAVLFFRKEKNTLRLTRFKPEDIQVRPDEFSNHTLDDCLCGAACTSGKTIYSENVYADTRCTREECKKLGMKSLTVLPLYSGQELFGIICVAFREKRKLKDRAEFIEAMSRFISVSLTNALHYEEARKSEESLKNLVDSSPFGIHEYRLDPDGRLIFRGANPAADRILGVDNSQFIGKTIEDAFPALVETEIPDRYREAAAKGTSWETEQIEYAEGDIKGAFSVIAYQTSPGKMAAQFHDITERKRLETRLRLFEEAVESSTDAIGMATAEGIHFYQNAAFDRLFGRIGKNPELVYADEAVGREVFRTITSGMPWAGEVDMKSADGSIRRIFLRAYPSRDETGSIRVLVGVHTDITERQKLLEAAGKNQKLEALGVLAGGIAHDFNNLLGGIFGYMELASVAPDLPSAARKHLEHGLDVMERARGLTSQLLTFSRGGDPVKEYQSVFPFVEKTVRFALSGSNVSCAFTCEENLWGCCFDASQIGQVVDNLVINAVQAMPGGGHLIVNAENITAQARNCPHLPDGPYVAIRFTDQGVGIPENMISKIFDPFFTTKSKGHGLGLATCYSIITRHGGSIDAESEPGNGSTFTIYLPASVEEEATAPAEESVEHAGSGRFLVMDDEAFLRDILSRMLEKMGYKTVCVTNGQQALDEFKRAGESGQEFTAVILDLTVPGGMGGQETITEIRKINSEIPVFVASGYASEPVMANPREYGFTASIAKPFKVGGLKKVLDQYLS